MPEDASAPEVIPQGAHSLVDLIDGLWIFVNDPDAHPIAKEELAEIDFSHLFLGPKVN